jgi:hypothetical protein
MLHRSPSNDSPKAVLQRYYFWMRRSPRLQPKRYAYWMPYPTKQWYRRSYPTAGLNRINRRSRDRSAWSESSTIPLDQTICSSVLLWFTHSALALKPPVSLGWHAIMTLIRRGGEWNGRTFQSQVFVLEDEFYCWGAVERLDRSLWICEYTSAERSKGLGPFHAKTVSKQFRAKWN